MQKIDLSGGTGGTSGQTTYTAPNGVIVTSSAPVYNNSNYYYMGYLFNNTITQNNSQPTTYWLTSSSGNQTLTFDFQKLLPLNISQINVYPRARDDASSNYRILVSDDGTNWTEVVSWVTTSTSTPYGTKFTHNVDITQRYVRFELTQNGSWGVCLSEIEFYRSGVNFNSPNKILIDSNSIVKINFKKDNIIIGSIDNLILNQEYNILDYVSGLNYKDKLVVEGLDLNNNIIETLKLNVQEDVTGKQGILETKYSIDTKDWDSVDSIQVEIEGCALKNIAPLTFGGTITASSSYSSNIPQNAVDLNIASGWQAPSLSGYIIRSFYTPVYIVKTSFLTGAGYASETVTYNIYISTDDVNFIKVYSGSAPRQTWVKDIPINRYVKSVKLEVSFSANWAVISEWELYSVYLAGLLLSNDNKQTWYTYQNNQFIPLSNPTTDIFTQGITDLFALPPLTKQNFLTDKLDIMVGLKSNSVDENPVFKGININYKINDYIINNYIVQDIFDTNLVPALTSNTSASPIVVSASSIYSSTYDAWKAFNNTLIDATDCWATASGTTVGWLKVDFGTPKIVNKYIITARNNSTASTESPKAWAFEGSNDNTNWVILDTRTNEINWSQAQQREYTFTNTTAYRYYRIYITANNGNTGTTTIGEIKLINVFTGEYIYQSNITDNIYKFNFNINGDNYKVFLSKDGGTTWLTYNGTDFIEGGDGNYIWEINNLSQELLMQFLPISNFRLKFEPIDDRAVLNSVTINYSVKTNSVLPLNAKEALLPIPPQYFRNVLQEDGTYTLKLEEGLSFDDVNEDYDFYSTPTKIKLRPLDLGTVIGNKWSGIYAFEVINSYDNQDYNITLRIMYNGEYAIEYNNSALLKDAELDNEKTIVEMSLTQEPFAKVYPLSFRLNRNSKQVVYIRIKPTITTQGTKMFQIRLTATPV